MPRSILTLTNEALAVSRLPTVLTLSGTDQRAVSLRALANKTVNELRRIKFWTCLWVDETINVLSGTATYPTPVDFDCMVPDTMYPSTGCKIMGGDTASQIQEGQNFQSLRLYPHFAIRGRDKDIVLIPTPTANETYSYIYKSSYAVAGSDTVAKEAITADDDYLIIDDELFQLGFLWRYKHSLGHEYGEDFNTYERAVEQRYAQENPAPTIMIGRSEYDPLTDGYVQERNYG